uniref:Uncharacterized protein n=1 Tax=Rhizophora mucronata TaxID=61149 RepID=A0A2P2PG93_RHIMU
MSGESDYSLTQAIDSNFNAHPLSIFTFTFQYETCLLDT